MAAISNVNRHFRRQTASVVSQTQFCRPFDMQGTVEPWTIGTKVSSGCIRLLNQDIIDLYNRVRDGSKAIALPIRSDAMA